MSEEKVTVYGYGLLVIFGEEPAALPGAKEKAAAAAEAVKGYMGYDDLDESEGEDTVYYFFLTPEKRSEAKEAIKDMIVNGEIRAVMMDYPNPVAFDYI